ncbi:hypothetical protein DPEC_G00142040 [Dallia pectoralis]|uniref:Uncharacterized protein n=1 Tax=Dallia pectoralis TaxID=75939 RepID=A0ACC2GMK8_DALPE|nr:hypothetical protein DPEC_G00142040 [Dallia pectoralis]
MGAMMRISWMPFLIALAVPPVHCFLNGNCLKEDPPPGVLVLPPGSTLVLGCSGLVEVNGQRVKVNRAERTSSNTGVLTTTDTGVLTTTDTGVLTTTDTSVRATTDTSVRATTDTGVLTTTDTGVRATTDTGVRATTDTGVPDATVVTETDNSQTNRLDETVTRSSDVRQHTTLPGGGVRNENRENVEKGIEHPNKGGGKQNKVGQLLHTVNQPRRSDSQSRPTPAGTKSLPITDRGAGGPETEKHPDWWNEKMGGGYEQDVAGGRTVRSQWRLNGRLLGGGAVLTVPSVTVSDSGNYSCQRRGTLVFSLRVSVAVPPETPALSCYKRSPTSKIRCDWTASQSVTPAPQCYLLVQKGSFSQKESFSRVNCSYSTKMSRCWCAMDHQVENDRVFHLVNLCVANIAGNKSSDTLYFQPLAIMKPDPPSNVMATAELGQERRLRVSWSVPRSWKERDRYHELQYELKYHTLPEGIQINGSTTRQTYSITDALPGVLYLIQVRAKEEFDGYWSEWSQPVYASTWAAPGSTLSNHLPTIMPDVEESGSGMTEEPTDAESETGVAVWPHVLWVVAFCVGLSVTMLSIYLYRHRVRLMSKLCQLSSVSSSTDDHSPPATTLPTQEGHALVNFPTSFVEEPHLEEEQKGEETEEEEEVETWEVFHFNNTSYFLVQNN